MAKTNSKIKFIVGIDEAGRGPLAGPVAVGAVLIPVKFKGEVLSGAKDSKLLSEKNREIWFKKVKQAKKDKALDYAVSLVASNVIDEKGISFAIKKGIKNVLNRLQVLPTETLILLDGSLKAPEHFLFQETIVGGDRLEPIISLASIAAKATRDKKMLTLSKKYPEYGFDIHKGYGTFKHREKIKKYGLSEIHRRSFCGRLG